MTCGSVDFDIRDISGSKLRCLLLTGMPRKDVARVLTRLAAPFARIDPNDVWMPVGFQYPEEARIGATGVFLTDTQRQALLNWWLVVRSGANTPNWDIVSTCTIEDRKGLLLIEAKAHAEELYPEGKSRGNMQNDAHIEAAICEANKALNRMTPGWNLSRDRCYQLSNRFAWGWKVASLGVPVVLIYLGFRNSTDLKPLYKLFATDADWKQSVRDHAQSIVPTWGWETPLTTGGAPFVALIRSLQLVLDFAS